MPAPHCFWLSTGQCLPPELVSCSELCKQGWIYTRNCRSKLLLFNLYNFSLCFLLPKFIKWFFPFSLYDFSHDICVQNLTCGKNGYFLCPVLPYYPRQIRLNYLAIEIDKVIIRVKYLGDSCKIVFILLVHYCFVLCFSKEEKEIARHKQFSPNWNVLQVSESFNFLYGVPVFLPVSYA